MHGIARFLRSEHAPEFSFMACLAATAALTMAHAPTWAVLAPGTAWVVVATVATGLAVRDAARRRR